MLLIIYKTETKFVYYCIYKTSEISHISPIYELTIHSNTAIIYDTLLYNPFVVDAQYFLPPVVHNKTDF